MQKNLFRKYLGVTTFIVAICLFFIMIVMITLVSNQWRDEKRELLSKNAAAVSVMAGSTAEYDEVQNVYRIDRQVMQSFVKFFAQTSDADIFITDLSGERLMGDYTISGTFPDKPVPQDVMLQLKTGVYSMQTNLGGAYSSPYYVVGTPIAVSLADGTTVSIGAVFMAASPSSLTKYWFETLHMFLWVGIAVLMLSFCLVWGFTYRMVNPLRQMSAAAHSFGNGDFSRRVPVTSEDEIGQLARSFNTMAESLASSENMRRSFIANVSHELKTPMTTIAGFIDGILDGTIPQEEAKKYLAIVSGEVKRLSRLVQSMLALSRIDSGELKLRPGRFNLTSTVLNVLLTFEKGIDSKNIEIRGAEDFKEVSADGDADLLHQVVYNLIDNAVKFTDENGYIELRVYEEGEKTGFFIRNSGPGISAEDQKMIFDRFYKTDKSRSKDKNGMGLGLYLVKTIIGLHGGGIEVHSVENEYTEFNFWLPKKPEPPKLKENVLPAVQDTEYVPAPKKSKKTESIKQKEGE